MARVPLIDEHTGPDVAAIAAKIRGKRGGRLLNLYRALLHAPELASAWIDFNNAVRYQTGLGDRVRELIIMRVAALTGCAYVWRVHQTQYAGPAGVTPREVEALRDWRRSGLFGAADSALLAYTDAMTRDVTVADDVFKSLREHYSERDVVEITVLVAAYNMHTRVLKALDIDAEKA